MTPIPDNYVVYDVECYPNVFTFTAHHPTSDQWYVYEISNRISMYHELRGFLLYLKLNNYRMVAFNNIHYDYPMIHRIFDQEQAEGPDWFYQKNQEIFTADREDRFKHVIWDRDQHVKQIDLFKIHHFDNVSRMTSLKALEFHMRVPMIKDLPFTPGSYLSNEDIDVLLPYNKHDVDCTTMFLRKTMEMIVFREQMGEKFINYNDTKLGKQTVIDELQKAGIQCYDSNRKPRQTPRSSINLGDVILPMVKFDTPEFQRVHEWLKNQTIVNTKGELKTTCQFEGLTFTFGTGGMHASVEKKVFESDDERYILDVDVRSYYPELAIVNRLYPEHLTERFCDIYEQLYIKRSEYPKGTLENKMLKLALNGTYGASNDIYSPFYDPRFTMATTINGQLLVCMLAEWLSKNIPGMELIQVNTDGLTIRAPRDHSDIIDLTCLAWETRTGLTLEQAEYTKMAVRDVNSYIAVKPGGETKTIGAYDYEPLYHQNPSSLVVAKAAEAYLVHGTPIEEFVNNHRDFYDFMVRVKVPRTSKLYCNGDQIQNLSRVYVTKGGGQLIKVMPPLAKRPNVMRRFVQLSGWTVCVANDMTDATMPLNTAYYVNEAKKLTEFM